jgi:putative ABC transport system substrate-binding protein
VPLDLDLRVGYLVIVGRVAAKAQVAIFAQPHGGKYRWRGAAARETARRAGIALLPAMLVNFDATEYQRVFRSMEQDRADAFMISDEPKHITYRATIVQLAAKDRLAAIYPLRGYVEVGGLMAYSIDLPDMFRRIANVIDRVLKGANP